MIKIVINIEHAHMIGLLIVSGPLNFPKMHSCQARISLLQVNSHDY